MNESERFEPYQAYISEETLNKWNKIVTVWSQPTSPIEGARVVDEIKQPLEVTVVEEQLETYGLRRKRAKIRYDEGREGWVLAEALTVKK